MKVKPTTSTPMGGPVGTRSISGVESNLLKASIKSTKNEARSWLLRSIISRNLATRDIYSFVLNQAELRRFNKVPDSLTIKRAMRMKLE